MLSIDVLSEPLLLDVNLDTNGFLEKDGLDAETAAKQSKPKIYYNKLLAEYP